MTDEKAIINYANGDSAVRPHKNKQPVLRKMSKALEQAGRKQAFHIGLGKKTSKINAMETMVYDLITNGETVTADGNTLYLKDMKQWVDLVKFVHAHVDGPVYPNQPQIANVNVVKVYAGINPDDV